MRHLLLVFLASLVVPIAQGQEVQKPARVIGDWCEYEVDGVGVSRQRREVVDVASDGGYTVKFTDDGGEHLRVFNSDGHMIRRGNREYTRISSSGAWYPISAKTRGRVSKYSRPHDRRGVIVEVTSEVRSVEPEKITVPAGTFDTLRVEQVSDYRYQDGSYSNQFVDTIWYALDAKMKFPVKFTFIDYGSRTSSVTRVLSKCGSAQPGK